MFDPRATYSDVEYKANRRWWITFVICLIPPLWLGSLIAMFEVSRDKKLLKKMALTIVYASAAFMVGTMIMLWDIITQAFEFVFLIPYFGGAFFIFGMIVAVHAQLRIDKPKNQYAGSNESIMYDTTNSSCSYEGCGKPKTAPYMVCIDHLCSGCVSGREPCGVCIGEVKE